MKKNDNQNVSFNQIKFHPPQSWLYKPFFHFARFVSKIFFGLKIDSSETKGLKGPFVVLGNHASPLDVFFMLSTMLPNKINVLTSRDLISNKYLKMIAKPIGLLPKSQFSIDLNAIKLMKKGIEDGHCVGIFPEGRISLDGRPLHYLAPSIAKFLKLLDATVVMCKFNGAFHARPRWLQGFKKGVVTSKTYVLFTREELKAMPVNEVYKKVIEAMSFNDNIYQIENNIRFKSKMPAKGLDYVLYKCPKCNSEYENYSTDKNIICKHCGNNVEYTEYGKLIPIGDSVVPFERIDQWFVWQRDCVKEEITQPGYEFVSETNFISKAPSEKEFVDRGNGKLYFNLTSFGYRGTCDNENIVIDMPLKTNSTCIVKDHEGIELTIDDVMHRFYFNDHKNSVKFGLMVEEGFRHINNIDFLR